MPKTSLTDEERFLIKVDKTGDCWLWTAEVDKEGYGRFWFNKKKCLAHRVSYQFYKGELEPGKVIMHTCDVPGCVKPDHLLQGTVADNNRDAIAKGRKAPYAGKDNPRAKLTPYQVEKIRAFHAAGISQIELSRTFNVSRAQIRNIIIRKHWDF